LTGRVELPKKTTQAPSIMKRWRVATTKKDITLCKQPRKEKTRALQKTMNVSQHVVERYRVDIDDQQSSSQARYISEAGTSENSDDLVLGNHEMSNGIHEFFINYASSREVYDRSTTITNLCFSTVIVENFPSDPDPKTMTECKIHLNWNKWKEAIEAELNSLKKRKVITDVIPIPPRTFPIGFK
jgi:hypothetical protein